MSVTAGVFIRSDRATVWRYTQTPELHARWDLRFTEISYLPRPDPAQPQRFRYATRLAPGMEIAGWGETVPRPDQSSSALRYGSEDRKSLIREGSGSWVYREIAGGVLFQTRYDYHVRGGWLGRVLDRTVLRPWMSWATRWSFDRLRLWIEEGTDPATSFRCWAAKLLARCTLGAVWLYEGLVPKILHASPEEIGLVERSGVYLGSPAATLAGLGAFEIVLGCLLLWGRIERATVALATVTMLVLSGLVLFTDPAAGLDPLGGLSKNLALLGCAAAVWLLAPIAPRAHKPPAHASEETATSSVLSPFARALGDSISELAPRVREHFSPPPSAQEHAGIMYRVWRAGGLRRLLSAPFLHLGGLTETLFPESGENVPFRIRNELLEDFEHGAVMIWDRHFEFPGRSRRFQAAMHFDPRAGVIRDHLGRGGRLEVELHARAEGGRMLIRSGRQWLRLFQGALLVPIPAILAGRARIEEWECEDGRLGIRVTIANPLLGDFFGYEGEFALARDGPRS